MKTGMTLEQLAAEVDRRSRPPAKQDILATTRLLTMFSMQVGGAQSMLNLGKEHGFKPLNEYAHGQVASYTQIPKVYYDRMRERKPQLFDTNVNTWFQDAPAGENRLVRCLDGRVRAFLSDRYRPLDHDDLLTFLLPELFNYPDIVTESLELTERRIYIKVSLPSLVRTIKPGHDVRMGLIAQNSEVGAGVISVQPFTVDTRRNSGMVHPDMGKRSHHVGKQLGSGEGIEEYFTDETRKADDKAFFLKVRDVIRAVLTEKMLERVVEQMQLADGVTIEQPEAAIRVIAQQGVFTEEERSAVLRHFIEGGNISMLGLASAVSAAAEESEDYDRATELETFGGKLITLEPKTWKSIASGNAIKKDQLMADLVAVSA